jgi:arylsulfatase A-like enzyme
MPDGREPGTASTRACPGPAGCAVLLATLAGCAGGGGPATAPRDHPNVLLITVDTLRPDHLGCYGYGRPTSRFIDTLARRGVVFSQAITAAGRTVQSFPSILTGVYPMVHGLRFEGQNFEGIKGRLTLTRALKENGYESFAVTQGLNVGLHYDFDMYDPDIYLDQEGKKVYLPTRSDSDASRKAVQWLRGGRKRKEAPFFLWMRYNAPHWPYEAPAPYTEMFDPDYRGPHTFNDEAGPGVERGDIIFGRTRLPSRQVEHAVAHYDGEVACADHAVGELLGVLQAMGLLDRTLVVLTSDHGESLGEHDYFFEHGAYLYEPTVRVPLIISYPPSLPAGLVVTAQARTIDIVPTVLEVSGVPIPAGLQGRSLAPRMRGAERGAGPLAYSESGRNFYKENPRQYVEGVAGKWRMMRSDRFKLIMIPTKSGGPIWEFYDLESDPGETKSVPGRFPEEEGALRRALLDLLAADPGKDDREEPALPPELEENLRSLGYVGDRKP